jgi:hypothetical protein
LGSPGQGISHLSPRTMKIKNVGFKLYPPDGGIKRLDECGKQRLSTLE